MLIIAGLAKGWWDNLAWGTVPDWFAAVGTVGALFLGLALLTSDQRRKTRESADAFITWHLVEVVTHDDRPTNWTLHVHGYNGGSSPIPFAIVVSPESLPNHMIEFFKDGDGGITEINPGEKVLKSVPFREEPMLSHVFVTFTDGRGQRWYRHLTQNRYIGKRSFKLIMDHPERWKYPTGNGERLK